MKIELTKEEWVTIKALLEFEIYYTLKDNEYVHLLKSLDKKIPNEWTEDDERPT